MPRLKKKKKKAVQRRVKIDSFTFELPTKKRQKVTQFLGGLSLWYGREGIGKTTAAASFPDCMFITTEPGHRYQEIYEFNEKGGGTHNWKVFLEAVKLLEDNPDQFKTIVIDTVDNLYDMCLDHVCDTLGIDYPGKTSSGKQDYGLSWREVRKEFSGAVNRISRTNRGIIFISHVKEEVVSDIGGKEYTKIYPSMGKQSRNVVNALVDFIFYCEYFKGIDGEVKRIFVTHADETIWGKDRCDNFPLFLPMEKGKWFEVLQAAHDGKHPGVDPSTLVISGQSAEPIRKILMKQKASSAKKKMVKKKPMKKKKRVR